MANYKTVFVLGAGASKEAGAPLMDNFLDTAFDYWLRGDAEEYEEDFEDVYKAINALKVIHSNSTINLKNIEDVFAAFEMAKTLDFFPGKKNPTEIDSLIKSLKKLIVRTLEIGVIFNRGTAANASKIGEPVRPPYTYFLKMIEELKKTSPAHSVVVLTFNYDIALDVTAINNDYHIDYGIENTENQKQLLLLKLHGSLNWNQDNEEISPLFTNKSEFKSDFLTKVGTKENPLWKISLPIDEPVIVPPTWNKEDHYRNQISKVWQRAAKELAEADNVCIIGFSLPPSDSFFRYLYALGTAGDKILRKILVYNPDDLVKGKFEKLLGPGASEKFVFR